MDSCPRLTAAHFARSVMAVPPLARTASGAIDTAENAKLIRHLEQGGREDEVTGGGHRDEFGQALDHAHDGGLEQKNEIHEVQQQWGQPAILPGRQPGAGRHSCRSASIGSRPDARRAG